MDRNREAKRAGGMAAAANGLSRRRHRISSLRDSPEDDGPAELQEPSRLRVRGLKKDRDRDRDRDRERDRERERSSRTKRRSSTGRLMEGSNRDYEDGDDSSEHSANDDDEDDDDGAVGMLPPNNNHYHDNNHSIQQHRKCFPPAITTGKVLRAATVWKSGDEMIGVSVPRKARSASMKRSHEWISGSGGVDGVLGEHQIHQQTSSSPVRTTLISTSTPSPAAPLSPSSSNASVRKKMKPNGSRVRPPKSSSKSSSSNPEELEIEIAKVLYGLMTQSQGPVHKVILSPEFDSREVNKSQNDAKSSVSSPTSNPRSTSPQPSSIFAQISGSSTGPISAVAPKRKKPRQVSDTMGSHGVQRTPLSSAIAITAKTESDKIPNAESPSSDFEKNFEGSKCENGGASCVLGNFVSSQSLPLAQESMKLETESMKFSPEVAAVENGDVVRPIEEVAASPKKGSTVRRLDDNHGDGPATAVARIHVVTEIDNNQGEKIQIDLMVPPPLSRSSTERKEENDLSVADDKPLVSDVDNEMGPVQEMGPVIKEKEDKVRNVGKDEGANLEYVETAKEVVEEAERHKLIGNKGKKLQFDLEKPDIHTCSSHKLQQQVPRQEQQIQKSSEEEARAEKPGLSNNLPLPMTMASWPGGLPPLGCMAPLRGVVSMDGSTISPPSMQPLFSQPRPKRCSTHCYIARNIHYIQQFMKMNPFWPAAAGTASLFGAKPCNVNAVPSSDLQGSVAGRGVNHIQEKTQNRMMFPGHNVKDKGYQVTNFSDSSQRKPQILLQQAFPSVATNNLMHGPAFIFPLNQHQVALTSASIRPGSSMSSGTTGNSVSSSASISASVSASATAAGVATALSFNYPTIPANESQYLAILQNNAYPFPIPAVGAPPNYRGPQDQTMSFFNGSIYSPQMIHQSQQHQQPHSQPHQIHQSHPNTSISSSSSSSQKHIQSWQQKSQVGGFSSGSGNGNLHDFKPPKNRLLEHSQQKQHFQSAKQSYQQESEVGGEDSPSTADSRISRGTANAYVQNFVMPVHTQNFALIAPPATLTGADTSSANGNTNEKKQVPQPSLRTGVESLPPQTFAMSFAPNIDISSMAKNHAILQGLPEATRQFMAAAGAAQKKKIRICEEGRSSSRDSSNPGEERKGLAGMTLANIGKSVAFSRSDLTDSTGSAIPGNSIIDSSAQLMRLTPGAAPKSNSSIPDPITTINSPSSQLPAQLQHQPQQIIQLHQQPQQQYVVAATSRNKTSATCNGSAYSQNFSSSSSSMTTKFTSALSGFPQSRNSSSPTESPQWRNSNKRSNSQVPTSLASSAKPSLKNIPHQQLRGQQIQMQMSFGANQKVAMPQGQHSPGNSESISATKLVGYPTSISTVANGSPKIGSSSTSNKASQALEVVLQQAKNSQSVSSLRSSPVSGRNISSILGNPQTTLSSSTGTRPQQQLPKNMQQAHVFFSPYMQAQPLHSVSTTSTSSATGGCYLERRQPEQLQQPQQPSGSSAPSSTGVVSLCPPVTLANSGCMDPTKTIATASNMRGGFLPGGILQPVQFNASAPGLLPTGFSYLPTASTAAHARQAEQK